MTNLDRLKGTPYLLDGFRSFLDEWFGRVKPEPFPTLTEEEEAVFEECPLEVLRFHEVVQRYPVLWSNPPAWLFDFPPSELGEAYPQPDPRLKVKRMRVIANQYQGVCGVMVSLDPHNFGQLWISDIDATRIEPLRGLGLDELLVLIAMTVVVDCSPNGDLDVERFDEATILYSGTLIDVPLVFHHHPGAGKLWIGSDEIPYHCVERP